MILMKGTSTWRMLPLPTPFFLVDLYYNSCGQLLLYFEFINKIHMEIYFLSCYISILIISSIWRPDPLSLKYLLSGPVQQRPAKPAPKLVSSGRERGGEAVLSTVAEAVGAASGSPSQLLRPPASGSPLPRNARGFSVRHVKHFLFLRSVRILVHLPRRERVGHPSR